MHRTLQERAALKEMRKDDTSFEQWLAKFHFVGTSSYHGKCRDQLSEIYSYL